MKEANTTSSESFPTHCANCGVAIKTERFRGKGLSSDKKPHGHKDPRHATACYCSIKCSKEVGIGGTVYGKK